MGWLLELYIKNESYDPEYVYEDPEAKEKDRNHLGEVATMTLADPCQDKNENNFNRLIKLTYFVYY